MIAITLGGGLLAWAAVAVLTADSMPERADLASAVEESCVPLLDRLNTLVFIHDNRADDLAPYADAIEKQTVNVLHAAPDQCPYRRHRIRTLSVILVGLILLNVFFYSYYRPWNNLGRTNQDRTQVSSSDGGAVPEIPKLDSPDEQSIAPEDHEPWGEVRISEPGRDLRVTMLDIVPLHIEAVTNRDIHNLLWFSSLNDEDRKTHTTQPPQDRFYAVHQTEMVVEEFGLQNWDVLSYFAEVTTKSGMTCQSDIYFLDVVPFAEELEKLPGGTEGAAYQALNDLTAMVERHEEIIRQTRRLPLLENRSESERAKRYAAFAQEQDELALATKYLKARLQQQFDRAPLESVNEQLDEAELALEESKKSLNEQDSAAAGAAERRGLAKLARARKELYEKALEHPDKFDVANDDPLAEAGLKESQEKLDLEQLKRIAEDSHQQAEATEQLRDKVAKLLQQQRQVEKNAESPIARANPQLTREQQGIHQSLQELARNNPESVQQLSHSWQWAGQSTSAAADSLRERSQDAQERVATATEDLEALHDALQDSIERARLIEALTLERRLRENIQEYAGMKDKPEDADSGERTGATDETKEIVDQLDELAENSSPAVEQAEHDPETPSSERSALQESLTNERKREIDADSQSLRDAKQPAGIQQSAGSLEQNLEEIAKALEQQNRSGLQQVDQDRLAQQMKAMQHRADELQAAREFVQQSLLKQRDIERSLRTQSSTQARQYARDRKN